MGSRDGERLRDRVEEKWDSREIGVEMSGLGRGLGRRCQHWAEAWVGVGHGLRSTASGGIEACNGKKWRVLRTDWGERGATGRNGEGGERKNK